MFSNPFAAGAHALLTILLKNTQKGVVVVQRSFNSSVLKVLQDEFKADKGVKTCQTKTDAITNPCHKVSESRHFVR